MKRMCTAAFLALWLALTGGAAAQEASYADGIYRGFYYDGGIEQIAIQFELQDGVFQSVVYRGVKYKDGDYMSDDASDAQKAALRQYRELAAYLVGRAWTPSTTSTPPTASWRTSTRSPPPRCSPPS